MIELLTGYLSTLRNADHVGVTQQIYDTVKDADIENDLYAAAAATLKKAIADEDDAYKKTQKDWAVEDLKLIDGQLDAYMRGLRQIVAGHADLPATVKTKQAGLLMLQLWKDYQFKLTDSYTAESSKVINMFQEVEKNKEAAQSLGIYDLFKEADKLARQIQELLNARYDDIASRTVGEMRTARKNTDQAIKKAYQVIDALQVLENSDKLTELLKKLRAIEDYARTYYIKGGASDRDNTPEETPGGGSGSDSGSGDSGSGSGGADTPPDTGGW